MVLELKFMNSLGQVWQIQLIAEVPFLVRLVLEADRDNGKGDEVFH